MHGLNNLVINKAAATSPSRERCSHPLFYMKNKHYSDLRGTAMTRVKGHESRSYETLLEVAGLLFKFTIVKMRWKIYFGMTALLAKYLK